MHLDLPSRLRGFENNNFVQGLAMNTENYVNFTIHSASNTHWTQAIKIIIFRNIIQSFTAVRGCNIWHQDQTIHDWTTVNMVVRMLLTVWTLILWSSDPLILTWSFRNRKHIPSLEELNVFSLERTREKRKFPIGVHMPYRFFYCPTDAYGVLLSDTVNIWYLLLNAKEIDR
jgi:hypothetical protein